MHCNFYTVLSNRASDARENKMEKNRGKKERERKRERERERVLSTESGKRKEKKEENQVDDQQVAKSPPTHTHTLLPSSFLRRALVHDVCEI